MDLKICLQSMASSINSYGSVLCHKRRLSRSSHDTATSNSSSWTVCKDTSMRRLNSLILGGPQALDQKKGWWLLLGKGVTHVPPSIGGAAGRNSEGDFESCWCHLHRVTDPSAIERFLVSGQRTAPAREARTRTCSGHQFISSLNRRFATEAVRELVGHTVA